MNSPDLTVIIPAYNEAARIGPTIERVLAYLGNRNAEVIVVDDGSRDATSAEVVRFGGRETPVRLLRHARNQGKGAAVRAGILEARGKILLVSDADLSTPIEDVEKLEQALCNGADVAVGSRELSQSKILLQQPWHRRLMGRVFNLVVQLILGLRIRDTQCGFKLFRASEARALFEPLEILRMSFDVEILCRAASRGLRIREVPVRWDDSPSSRVRLLLDPVEMFWDVWKIRSGGLGPRGTPRSS